MTIVYKMEYFEKKYVVRDRIESQAYQAESVDNSCSFAIIIPAKNTRSIARYGGF